MDGAFSIAGSLTSDSLNSIVCEGHPPVSFCFARAGCQVYLGAYVLPLFASPYGSLSPASNQPPSEGTLMPTTIQSLIMAVFSSPKSHISARL